MLCSMSLAAAAGEDYMGTGFLRHLLICAIQLIGLNLNATEKTHHQL